MKPTEQYFPVVLFIMLYKVFLTFETVDEILKCDHSNESYWAVLSCGTVYYAVQSASNFWVCEWNPYKCQDSNESYRMELFCSYVIMLYKFALTFEIKKLQSSTFKWWYLFVTLMVLSYDPDTIFRSSNWTQSTAALWPLKVKSLYQSITQNSIVNGTSGMNSRDPINSIIGSLIYDFTDQTWLYVTSHPKTYTTGFLFSHGFPFTSCSSAFWMAWSPVRTASWTIRRKHQTVWTIFTIKWLKSELCMNYLRVSRQSPVLISQTFSVLS